MNTVKLMQRRLSNLYLDLPSPGTDEFQKLADAIKDEGQQPTTMCTADRLVELAVRLRWLQMAVEHKQTEAAE